MEGPLAGLSKVAVHFDDILVAGCTESDHLGNLEVVSFSGYCMEAAGLVEKEYMCFPSS